MSGLSEFGKEVVIKALGKPYPPKTVETTYSVGVTSERVDSTVMLATFKFKKPIPESQLKEDTPEFLAILDRYLSAERLGVIDAVLRKYGLSPDKMGKVKTVSRASGRLPINAGESRGVVGAGEDSLTSIRTKSGRFISLQNFKGLLDLLLKKYMMDHMTTAGPQLKNRTGRFISTTFVSHVGVVKTGSGDARPTIRVTYDYMKYPYETFDPAGPNSLGLASYHRNPRKIIGESIDKAVHDIANMAFYGLEIYQR